MGMRFLISEVPLQSAHDSTVPKNPMISPEGEGAAYWGHSRIRTGNA